MKAHLAKVSLALLTTVFLLGCQEQGSGPVGPDTEIGGPNFLHQKKNPKPHGGGSGGGGATYTATFTDNVTGTTDNLFPPQGGKELMLSDFHDDVVLSFTAFLQTADGYSPGEGGHCFPAGPFGGILQISSNKPRGAEARIQFNFPAGDKVAGTTEINYTLILRGDFLIPREWAPLEVLDMATINGGTFEVGPSGGPGDISCKGTGLVSFSLVVTRTS